MSTASNYNNILIRTSLDDDGTLPRTGDITDSPDVIPYGVTEVSSPVSFFIDNYDENVNAELEAAQTNYIYVRGKDLVRNKQTGDVYVYYSKDSDLNSPDIWSKNQLKTTSGKSFYPVVGQNRGEVVVAAEAFVWIVPVPADGETYSLIGVVLPSGTPPNFSGINNFETFVQENDYVGWTKVTIKKPIPPPIPGLRWQTTFNYSQGSVARDMTFEIDCKDIPVGTYVSFKADNTTGPTPPILLDKTKVSDPKGRFGMDSSVPADYTSTITFGFYSNSTPPAGSSLTFKAYYIEGKTQVNIAVVTTTN